MPLGSLAVVARPALRRSARAAVIGLGLVMSAAVGVPSALAVEIAGADVPSVVPDFTVDGTLSVQLAAAPAPADLDLSGARFEVLDSGGAIVGSCDTDGSGVCDVPMTEYAGTPAVFSLVQDADHPVPGLLPSSAVSTFTVHAPGALDCPTCTDWTVSDASLFRSGLALTVLDAATQVPLAGAEFSLTGPDYRHRPAVPQEAETTVFPDPTLSGSDGRLTFPGWFLPGDWSLTPEVTPRGYRSSGVLPVTLPPLPATSGDTWSTVVDLVADVPDVGTVGGPPPVSSPAPRPAPTPAVHAPIAASPDGASPVVESPSVSPAVPTVAAAPAVAPVAAGPSPTPEVDAPALDSPPRDPAAASGEQPPLRVAAVTSSLDVGLVGFGGLLATLVVFGVGYLRRRAAR